MHDDAYKLQFSHLRRVADLLRSFLPGGAALAGPEHAGLERLGLLSRSRSQIGCLTVLALPDGLRKSRQVVRRSRLSRQLTCSLSERKLKYGRATRY